MDRNIRSKAVLFLAPLLIALALTLHGGAQAANAAQVLPTYLAEEIRNEQGQLIGYRCRGKCAKGDLCCTVFPW